MARIVHRGAERTCAIDAKPVIREHRIPTPDSEPYIAIEGPDRKSVVLREPAPRKSAASIRAPARSASSRLPSRDSMPVGIAAGGDGNLWFTEKAGNRVGRISLSGAIAEYRASDRQGRVRTASLSAPTTMSGSPRATPTASRASRRTAASPNSAPA